MGRDVLVRRAAEAIDVAPSDPRRAESLLAGLGEDAARDAESHAMVERALGLIALSRGDTGSGVRHLRTAVRRAQQAGLEQRAAEARMSLAFALFMVGDTAGALREADRAAPALSGLAATRLALQRASILARAGRTDEALAGFRTALTGLRRAGDLLWEAKLRLNRGWLHTYRGDWHAAAADLERLQQLAVTLDSEALAAEASHNLGIVAAIQGNVPLALARYDAAEEHYRVAGRDLGLLFVDRAAVLLSVGLGQEGRQAAEAAVAETRRRNLAADLAEAQLMLARAALLTGDAETAARTAAAAQHAFRAQRRAGYEILARFIALQARWQGGHVQAAAALRTAQALEAAGWRAAALDARIIAARSALAGGRHAVARRELALASRARRAGPADLRVRAWQAEALRRLADGDARGTYRALDAGLRVLDEFKTTLGAFELQSVATALGQELAETGLGLALGAGRAATALAWSERWRAGVLRLGRVRPPQDPKLADDLAQLRRVARELDEARLTGRDTRALVHELAAYERAVRRRARHAPGGARAVARFDPAALHDALGERVLVEMIGGDGRLHAVTAARGRLRLFELGDRDRALAELAGLRFALGRLAARRGAPRALAAAEASAQRSAERLDALLLDPVRAVLGDQPAVIVPTGSFHALPWSLLPSLSQRAVTVAPSAAWWQGVASADEPADGATALIAGPGLEHAQAEVDEVAGIYPAATLLSGERATGAAVADAMDGAKLVHVAAHGRFRSDNPLFSRLELADGPLTVYDLERLRRGPDMLVLSACESGLSAVQPGDELMGLTAVLFSLGARTVIGSVVPVSDAATRELMLALHRGLRAGLPPAAALASAQTADCAGFVCFGAG